MSRPPGPGSRDRILQVAGRLFYEHGVRAVGMARVVDEAGCGKNLLYRHFPSKDDLVAAWLLDFGSRREHSVGKTLDGLDEDPAAALVALVREVADRLADPWFRGCAFRNYLREVREDDAPRQVALDWLARSRAQVDDLVTRLDVAEADVLADRVWLVLEGLYASALLPDRARAGEAGVRLVQELVPNA